jgi:hypothetical protein
MLSAPGGGVCFLRREPKPAPAICAAEGGVADEAIVEENGKRYWITPPDVYNKLHAEFGFDFDPCPYPRPEDYDSLVVPWGKSSYANPPFLTNDSGDGAGPAAFARKAIAEHKADKTVVLMLPTDSYVNLLLEAGAELRSAGRVRWLEVDTAEPHPSPPSVTCFVLRSEKEASQLRGTTQSKIAQNDDKTVIARKSKLADAAD